MAIMREPREQTLPGTHNLSFVEGLYGDYLRDRESVLPEWRDYFDQLANGDRAGNGHAAGPSFRPFSLFNPPARHVALDGVSEAEQERVVQYAFGLGQVAGFDLALGSQQAARLRDASGHFRGAAAVPEP